MKRGAEPRIVDPGTHPRRYVSVRVAAAWLEVDAKTLAKFFDEGLLACVWFGQRRKVRVAELVAFEERQRRRRPRA